MDNELQTMPQEQPGSTPAGGHDALRGNPELNIICPSCGRLNNRRTEYCTVCGQTLPRRDSYKARPRPHIRYVTWINRLLIIVIVILILYIFYRSRMLNIGM